MKLVTSCYVGLEKECDCLEQIVDVSEPNVDVQSVLFLAVFGAENVSLVGLWGGLVAWNLDQFGHLDLQRELSLRRSYHSCEKSC